MGRLLDRYDAMQRRPFGTNTALTAPENNNPAVSQLRRQEKAYGQALRLLTRRARRGDVNSALSAIGVRDKAMADGFAPGGVRNNEQAEAGLQGIVGNMERRAADMEAVSGMTRQQAMEEMAPVATPGLDEPQAPIRTAGARLGEVQTPGIDRMREPGTEGMTFDEIEEQKRRKLTMEGAFGSGAKKRMMESDTRATGLLERARLRKRGVGYNE